MEPLAHCYVANGPGPKFTIVGSTAQRGSAQLPDTRRAVSNRPSTALSQKLKPQACSARLPPAQREIAAKKESWGHT